MLKKFNELSLKNKVYLIGGLFLLVIVFCFGLLNRQTVDVSLVFTQLSAPLILVIFTCLVIGSLLVVLLVLSITIARLKFLETILLKQKRLSI